MGRKVAVRVGERLGRTILELGGNNAVIVLDDADLKMAVLERVVRRGGNGWAAVHVDTPGAAAEGHCGRVHRPSCSRHTRRSRSATRSRRAR